MLIATGVMTCASMAPAMAAPNVDSNANVTVTNGANITVTEGPNKDGGKEYKVALKNDITLEGDDPDAFVGISGSKGTIWTSGKVTAGSVAVGTAKAMEMGETEGAMSSLSIAVSGLMTVIGASIFAQFM